MKHWAQKSFVSYMRSVYLQSNKEVFDVHLLPANDYATSLGLVQPPKSELTESVAPPLMSFNPPSQEQDQEFLTLKRTISSEEKYTEDSNTETLRLQKKRKSTTRVSQAKKFINKKLKLNTHIVFDEED